MCLVGHIRNTRGHRSKEEFSNFTLRPTPRAVQNERKGREAHYFVVGEERLIVSFFPLYGSCKKRCS
jgi:hypothetical protein